MTWKAHPNLVKSGQSLLHIEFTPQLVWRSVLLEVLPMIHQMSHQMIDEPKWKYISFLCATEEYCIVENFHQEKILP